LAVVGAVGCASPGPPRPPSLQLPRPVRDLTAGREGDAVTLRFTLPQRTTDDVPLRDSTLRGTLCRGAEAAPCVPIPSLSGIALRFTPGANAAARAIAWTDRLPADQAQGAPRLLLYRVRLANPNGRTAGWSEPAYVAAGAAPPPVQGLRADETPSGILLRWQPAAAAPGDEVLLEREPTSPSGPRPSASKAAPDKAAPGPVWLQSHAVSPATSPGPAAAETLDASATEDTPFRYVAVRRRFVQLGAHRLEVRSAPSAPVEITWRNLFPPPAPAGLSAAPFAEAGAFAVDLVWEPLEQLEQPGQLGQPSQPRLKGYLVTRQAIDAAGAPLAPAEPLGTVALPAFHDTTAQRATRYRYTVQAVTTKGVQGQPATVLVEPAQ
jgi:hypothetical protein